MTGNNFLVDTNIVIEVFKGNKEIADLYKLGEPIPTNDVWIAAIAIQYNLTILTADRHFEEIDNLKSSYP